MILVEFDVHCTFEDGDVSSETITTEKCRFEHDTSLGEVWTKRQGIDSTYGLGKKTSLYYDIQQTFLTIKQNSISNTASRVLPEVKHKVWF